MDSKQMKARIKAITKGFRKEGVAPVVEVDTNSLAYKVGTLLGNAGQIKQLAEAFGLITDLDILTPYNTALAVRNAGGRNGKAVNFLKPLVAVVPIKAYNSHTYILNEVVVMSSSPYTAVKRNGHYGNQLNGGLEGEVRLATDAEIDALTEEQVKVMIAEYT